MPESFDILHLSDTHLVEGEGLHGGRVATADALRRVLDRASALERLDLVALTGDLSDDGSADSYRILRGIVEPWASARGAAVAYVMGNHDLHDGFREVLGESVTSTMIGAGTRVITLDTAVPGAGYGRLSPEQLEWLRGELATPAPAGSVVLLHHPPVAAATPLLAALELQNPSDLADAIAGSDVRLILAGHYHLPLIDSLGGVPVVITGGVANQADLFAPAGAEAAFRSSAGTLVHLRADGVRVLPFTAPAPDDGQQLFLLDEAGVARVAAEAGPPAA